VAHQLASLAYEFAGLSEGNFKKPINPNTAICNRDIAEQLNISGRHCRRSAQQAVNELMQKITPANIDHHLRDTPADQRRTPGHFLPQWIAHRSKLRTPRSTSTWIMIGSGLHKLRNYSGNSVVGEPTILSTNQNGAMTKKL